MPRTLINCPYFRRAFSWSVPIGGLAGLIGLGGGEFRLPVLMYAVGFDAKSAAPLRRIDLTQFPKHGDERLIPLARRKRGCHRPGSGPRGDLRNAPTRFSCLSTRLLAHAGSGHPPGGFGAAIDDLRQV
jgi:hypothetical protein